MTLEVQRRAAPLRRNCGATIHRRFTWVLFGDPPSNVHRYGGCRALDRHGQALGRRDRHFCGRLCACFYGYHAANAGTAPTAKHAMAAEKQRAKLAARRRLVR
jgi:hypothetical protein